MDIELERIEKLCTQTILRKEITERLTELILNYNNIIRYQIRLTARAIR
jgi:hypothetical protein